MPDKKPLDELPSHDERDTGEQASVRPNNGQDYGYLFVDYDTIYTAGGGPRVYGNWRDAPYEACRDKTVKSYVCRDDLRDYDYEQDCRGSRDGIWRFTIAIR